MVGGGSGGSGVGSAVCLVSLVLTPTAIHRSKARQTVASTGGRRGAPPQLPHVAVVVTGGNEKRIVRGQIFEVVAIARTVLIHTKSFALIHVVLTYVQQSRGRLWPDLVLCC